MAFSPDGRRALSRSDDNTVRLWDMETGAALKQHPEAKQIPFKGERFDVMSVRRWRDRMLSQSHT